MFLYCDVAQYSQDKADLTESPAQGNLSASLLIYSGPLHKLSLGQAFPPPHPSGPILNVSSFVST